MFPGERDGVYSYCNAHVRSTLPPKIGHTLETNHVPAHTYTDSHTGDRPRTCPYTHWRQTTYLPTHTHTHTLETDHVPAPTHTGDRPRTCPHIHTLTHWRQTTYLPLHTLETDHVPAPTHTGDRPRTCPHIHTLTHWRQTTYLPQHNGIQQSLLSYCCPLLKPRSVGHYRSLGLSPGEWRF